MKIKTGCYTTLENHKIKSNFYVINRIGLCVNVLKLWFRGLLSAFLANSSFRK
ncbi:hypothetical protein SAMN05660236_5394 [Ohtaekwangia koreensis]|uniref:Uncharacterized protein n=1 Tax=Ohtaekwangia koreensis TaxID=688867 RepID=A0A1T5MH17_9BACT|nr:hypothetical protein SAMN05660236_5394 [Ohtaekwangia koreensis]